MQQENNKQNSKQQQLGYKGRKHWPASEIYTPKRGSRNRAWRATLRKRREGTKWKIDSRETSRKRWLLSLRVFTAAF
jgi:hypothetical protein